VRVTPSARYNYDRSQGDGTKADGLQHRSRGCGAHATIRPVPERSTPEYIWKLGIGNFAQFDQGEIHVRLGRPEIAPLWFWPANRGRAVPAGRGL